MSRRIAMVLATATSTALTASTLWAHPGHGQIPAEQPAHYLLEPLHAVPIVAIVALIAGATVYVVRMRQR